MPLDTRIANGKRALEALKSYKLAKEQGDTIAMSEHRSILQSHMKDFGYGYLESSEQAVPPIAITFYSFHLMVALGSLFFVLFIVVLYLSMANDITRFKKILWLCIIAVPFGYIAAEAGWIVAEVGRQPWAIQDLMPVHIAATNLSHTNVQVSFFIFLALFSTLLIAELGIMTRQIKKGFGTESSANFGAESGVRSNTKPISAKPTKER